MRYRLKTPPPSEIPKEQQEAALAIYEAALAEVGYWPEPYWDEYLGAHRNGVTIPDEIHDRARVLAFEATGIRYEWVEVAAAIDDARSAGHDG